MSHDGKPDKLVYMANQIGKFFAAQKANEAVPGITTHIEKFWDPRMRSRIIVHHASGGEGLDPLVKEAIGKLKPAPAAPGP